MLTIYTGGTFDCTHAGHAGFFKKIKKYFPDSFVIVALNTDDFVERYKGKKPIFNYAERHNLLENIYGIDLIYTNVGEENSVVTISDFMELHNKSIDVVVIGNDWLDKDYMKQMNFTSQWLTDNGIALCYLPHTDGISTTEIKQRILASV